MNETIATPHALKDASASRRTRWHLALASILAATVASGAFAQAAGGGRGKEVAAEAKKRFAAADVDHDGKLTKAEAEAGMPFVAEHFDEIDTARKGSVTMRDIAVFVRAKAAARKAAGSAPAS